MDENKGDKKIVNKLNDRQVKVTVLVVTYNHEPYIRKALESVVCQKTDFEYEIIVHDDVSNDGTTEIIREYERLYRNVTAVIEKENQYRSNGYLGIHKALKPYIHGEYVILLEGDDLWCDENKLQKQVDFLEKHPDYIAHTHLVKHVFPDGTVDLHPTRNDGKDWSPYEIIDWKDVFHASSLMYRSEYFLSEFDECYMLAIDFVMACHLIMNGKIGYSNDIMSIHNLYTQGSYTANKFEIAGDGFKKPDDRLKHLEEREVLCSKLDQMSNYEYHDLFVRSQERRYLDYCFSVGDYQNARRIIHSYAKALPLRKKIWIYSNAYIPYIVKIYMKIRNMKHCN